MNKNRQKNLFRQNLNINNKNMHENIYAQHPTVKSHCRHHKKLSAFHWRPWSDFNFSPSCSFSVCVLLIFYMTDFPNPCPEFCNCTGDPLRLQRGKAWRLNGFKLFIPAEMEDYTRTGKSRTERIQKKNMTEDTTQTLPLHKRVWPVWWRPGCVPVFTICFFQLCLSSDLLPSSAFIVLFGA